jgi:hypothetical protein
MALKRPGKKKKSAKKFKGVRVEKAAAKKRMEKRRLQAKKRNRDVVAPIRPVGSKVDQKQTSTVSARCRSSCLGRPGPV